MHLIRKTAVPTVLILTLFLSGGCKANQTQTAVNNDQYLSQDAVEKKADMTSYKYDTVIAGDFYEKVESNASFYVQDSRAARADYKYGEMIFDGFKVSVNTYVTAGDPIADVHIDISNSEIEEVRLKIQRMEERVVTDTKDYADSDAILKRKAYAVSDSQAQGVAIHEYEESVALHNQDITNRQTQIADLKEQIEKMEQAQGITQILAPIDGYLKDLAVLKNGDKVADKKIFAVVEPSGSNIITVNNSNNDFHYGKEVDVVMTTQDGEMKLTGTVITPSKISVASQASDKAAQIRLSKSAQELPGKEDIKKILVTVKSGEIKNALMIKIGSLIEDKNNTYATVVTEDGSFLKKSVIVGGKNKEYYWILRGLNEGDTVVIP